MFRTAVLLALAVAPFSSPLAAGTASVSATVSGYYALGTGYIPEAEWKYIDVVRNDAPLIAWASGRGGDFFTTCTVPCLYALALTSATVQGFASATPGVLRVFASDLAIATPMLRRMCP
jgi:hypothetical protein